MYNKQFTYFSLFALFIIALSLNQVESKVIFQDPTPKHLKLFAYIFSDNKYCYQKFHTLEGLKDEKCGAILVQKIFACVVVIFAALVKIPQIMKNVQNKSIDGISMNYIVFEMVGVFLSIFVQFKTKQSLLNYGDLYLIYIGDLAFLLVCWFYDLNKDVMKIVIVLIAKCSALIPVYYDIVSFDIIQVLYAASVGFIIFSRICQISLSFKIKSTGQLHGLTTLLELVNAIIRLILVFKTQKENNLQNVEKVASFILIFIMFIQLFWYWNSDENKKYEGTPVKTNRDKFLEQIRQAQEQEQEELRQLYEEQQKLLKQQNKLDKEESELKQTPEECESKEKSKNGKLKTE